MALSFTRKMKTLLLLLLVFNVIFISSSHKKSSLGRYGNFKNPRIVDGREATPHSLPYQVFLKLYYEDGSVWYNTGALISQNYILTSADCTNGTIEAEITLGAHEWETWEDTQLRLTSTEFITHENFNGDANNIGVIRLPISVRFTNAIRPIPLPIDDTKNYGGALATISGWGLDDPLGAMSPFLNFAQVRIMTNEDCEQIYGPLDSSVMCSSGENLEAGCYGDAGGPIVTDGEIVGVLAFLGEDCTHPTGFTRVTSFLEWIRENTDA